MICDVRQFGALGDGQADDTPAFLAAIAAASRQRGTSRYVPDGLSGVVSVPSGIYRITARLPLTKRGVMLRGEAAEDSILLLDSPGAGVTIAKPPDAIQTYRVRMEQITIDAAGVAANGLLLEDASECTLGRVSVYGSTQANVVLRRASGCVLETLATQGAPVGVLIEDTMDCALEHPNLYGATQAAVRVVGTSQDNHIRGAWMEACAVGIALDSRDVPLNAHLSVRDSKITGAQATDRAVTIAAGANAHLSRVVPLVLDGCTFAYGPATPALFEVAAAQGTGFRMVTIVARNCLAVNAPATAVLAVDAPGVARLLHQDCLWLTTQLSTPAGIVYGTGIVNLLGPA